MADKNPLMSKVSPPSELPSFIRNKQLTEDSETKTEPTFNPVIPPEKNITSPAPKQQESNESNDEPIEESKEDLPSMQDIANVLSPLTDGVKNSVLFGWVKDSFKESVKIAKESVDKVVTTLDPQMSQIICESTDYSHPSFQIQKL